MESFYERALTEAGQNGKFQKRFDILYNVLLPMLWVMAYNNMLLALTITSHTCKLPVKPENISEYSWKEQHIPMTEDVAGKIEFSKCLMYLDRENNVTMECNEYTYDTTWYGSTIPSDNNWVCDKELNVPNIYAYGKIGEGVGSIFFGWFADIYGRKTTYIISLALLLVGRSLSILASSSYILFAIGCIIAYFPSWSAVQSTAVISLEISSPKRRSTLAKFRLIACSFGMFLMPFIYWWLRNWKVFLIITTVTQLPYLLMSWKIIESPQWLWLNKQSQACVKQLRIISNGNEAKLDPETGKQMLTFKFQESNKLEVLGPLALFSGLRLSFVTILQLCLWVSVSLNYTAVLISSGEKSDGNPFLEFAWQSLAEIPGHIIAAWLADRIGRRYTGVASYSVTAFLWILNSLFATSTSKYIKNGWLSTILVVVNRFSMTISYYIVELLNMELYPTCLRQSGMSLGNVLSGVGGALASYVLYLGRHFDQRYPGVILAFISLLLGAMPSFLLPETLNAKLPGTINEARNFGRGQRNLSSNVRNEGETELALFGQ